MSINKIHIGGVKGGKFIPDNPAEFKQSFYGHEGKRICITVKRFRKSRSNNQNRYMWGVVYELISDHTGYTPDEVHSAMKFKFLRIRRNGLPDTAKSTSKLSTKDFESYLEKIRRWAAVEINCYIPLPHECDY